VDREIPFDFILDYLLTIEMEVRPFFGMFSIYSGQKLLLMLRDRKNEPEMNGIWIAMNKGHEALKRELPGLGEYPGARPNKKDDGWLHISPDSDNFEQLAIRICELIVHRDPRIGKIPPVRRAKSKLRTLLLPILLTALAHTLQAQQVYFPHDALRDSISMAQAMPALARQVITIFMTHPHPNNIPYYGQIFRCRIITGEYAEALTELDTANTLFQPKDSSWAASNLFAFRAYAATRLVMEKLGDTDFRRSFEPVFTSLYEPLSVKAVDRTEKTYNDGPIIRTANYVALTTRLKAVQKDSLSFADARSLCIDWMNYVVYGAELPLVDGLLRSIDEKRYIIEDSVLIPTRDGAQIAATIIRSRAFRGPQPVVLKFGIYASPDEVHETKYIAGHGYIGIIADTRGKRLSPQPIEPFIHDADDAYAVIDWISHQPWCNGKIGMYGGSYDGFATWAATKRLHPALKTIVPIASVGPGIDWPGLYGVCYSGTEALQWLKLVMDNKFTDWDGQGSFRYWDSIARRYYTTGIAFRSIDSLEGHPNTVYQEWLRHPGFDRYWNNMIPAGTEFAKIRIPVLTITGYFDDDQRGAFYYFDQHHRYAPGAEHYLVVGPYEHHGVQGYPIDPLDRILGYPIDSVAQLSIMDLVFGWFDHILKGAPLPDLLKDKINVEVMGDNRWRHVSSLRKLNNDTLDLYLSVDRKNNRHLLVPNHPGPGDSPLVQTVYLADRGDSSDHDEYYINGDGPIFSKDLKPGRYLTFVSDTVRRAFDLNGSFIADLVASVNKKDMDLAVDLYQQTPDGKYFQLSNNVFRCSYLADLSHRQLLTPGQPTHLYFDNSFFTSRHIEKGSRLVLLIGVNKDQDWQINYGTGKDVSTETIGDSGEPLHIRWLMDRCRIRLPVWRE
jgi:putative CocE/NonD family hydrolase